MGWFDGLFQIVGDASASLKGGGGTLISAVSAPARAERKIVRQDIKDLEANNFGYTDAEKSQMVAQQLGAIRAQSQAAQDANNRQGAASGGATSGRYFQTTQQIAKAAEGQSGEAMGRVQAMSQQKAAQDRAAALARIAAKSAANRQVAASYGAQGQSGGDTSSSTSTDWTSAYGATGGGTK